MLYLLSILFFVILIALVNIFTVGANNGYQFWEVILWSFSCTVVVIIIDAFLASLVRWVCPKSLFTVDKMGFVPSKRKCRFYEKLGIKKWKDKILELGALTGFRKNKIDDPSNNEYVERFIVECNYGVSVHICGIIFGFLTMFTVPKVFWLTIGLPVGIVNVLYNCLSLFILRYNLPKLHTLYKYNKRKQEKAEQTALKTA